MVTVFIPGTLILFFSFFVSIMIISKLKKSENLSKRRKQNRIDKSRQILFLGVILGLPLMLQYLMFNRYRDIFSLIFVLFNASQGFFFFLIFVIGNSAIKQHVSVSLGFSSTNKQSLFSSSNISSSKN